MTRSSFKVLLGDDCTQFDGYMFAIARQFMEDHISYIPGRHAVVRELSELLGMEPSRTRRLLNDLDIEVKNEKGNHSICSDDGL